MNIALEPDGLSAGCRIMFKRKQRPARPAIHPVAAAPEVSPGEDKVFNNADGAVSMSRPRWPDDGQDDFGGTRLNTPPASPGTVLQPPD